eukprot:TRINITY_DN29015_c0_g1_i1.p1 TRINITY_DN29015_c0_g1~~TRINITY_DN29015_c0_g1_i1.p1  ORF type:complete len:637 (+),score=174.63 TRINITY_DN29015_c0_g1_i1:90-1913(+)
MGGCGVVLTVAACSVPAARPELPSPYSGRVRWGPRWGHAAVAGMMAEGGDPGGTAGARRGAALGGAAACSPESVRWVAVWGHYLGGHAGGHTEQLPQPEAQRLCAELGPAECGGITCAPPPGLCSARSGRAPTYSRGGEASWLLSCDTAPARPQNSSNSSSAAPSAAPAPPMTYELSPAAANASAGPLFRRALLYDSLPDAWGGFKGRLYTVPSPLETFSILPPPAGCGAGQGATPGESGRVRGCVLSTNAGFFNTRTFACHGPVISDGAVVQLPEEGPNAALGLTADGRVAVGYFSAADVAALGMLQMVSGVGWIVRRGRPFVGPSMRYEDMSTQETGDASLFRSLRAPRLALGHDAQGQLLLLAVDGASYRGEGASLDEMADIMVRLGAVNAINLDGGGSVGVFEGADHLVNTPSDFCEDTQRQDPAVGLAQVCARRVTTITCVHPPDSRSPSAAPSGTSSPAPSAAPSAAPEPAAAAATDPPTGQQQQQPPPPTPAPPRQSAAPDAKSKGHGGALVVAFVTAALVGLGAVLVAFRRSIPAHLLPRHLLPSPGRSHRTYHPMAAMEGFDDAVGMDSPSQRGGRDEGIDYEPDQIVDLSDPDAFLR